MIDIFRNLINHCLLSIKIWIINNKLKTTRRYIMAAVAATTTASVVGTGVVVAGASGAAIFGATVLAGAGVALAFTPAFFIAPSLIAAASVPVTAGAEISIDYSIDINPHDLQASLDNELIQLNMEADYLG